MEPELKPCPFCRGEAYLEEFEPHKHFFAELPEYPGGAMITCQKCGGRLSFSGKDAKEKVIKAWNTRVTSYNDPLHYDTLRDRDRYHEMADKLADAIAEHFGVDIGEHSNMNCPWENALEWIYPITPEKRFDGFYYCNRCGQKLENWDYCPNCGQRLNWSEE